MKITAIRIRKLVSRPTGYGHDAAEIEAQVEEGENYEDVAARLHLLVEAEVRRGREIGSLAGTLDMLREDVVRLERTRTGIEGDIERIRDEIAAATDFAEAAEKAGLKLPPALQRLALPF
jgi:hypothetical protein